MSYSMTESEFRDLMRVTASDGCERRQVRSGSTSLLEKQPMSYAVVIWSVATDAIAKCHCYGHLCGHCNDAKVVLNALRHTHAHSDNADICAVCGLDLREDIHLRA